MSTGTTQRIGHPLSREEIVPGVVAFFDVAKLVGHTGAKLSYSHSDRKLRPFLCLAIEGVMSWWTPLTTLKITSRGEKLIEIKSQWKSGGGGTDFMRRDNCVHNVRSVAVLAARAVEDVTWSEFSKPGDRSRVSAEGVAVCLKKIRKAAPRRDFAIPEIPEARA